MAASEGLARCSRGRARGERTASAFNNLKDRVVADGAGMRVRVRARARACAHARVRARARARVCVGVCAAVRA
eukprot:3287548-Pleurochrysis_carterae.AAC.1